MGVALAIIAKDQVKEVKNIIDKYSKYFDEIVIAGDTKHEDFGKLTGEYNNCIVKYFQYKWINDFSDKRNFLTSKIASDYYFRLDTDDEIRNPEAVRQVVSDMQKDNISIVFCWYEYSKDAFGNVNAGHYRETIVDKRSNLKWNKKIHENILVHDKRYKIDKSINIIHNIDEKHACESAGRNIRILLEEYNKDRKNTDPRTLSYLGKMFLSIGDYKQAIYFFEKHIQKSGWDEDRYISWVSLSNCFHFLKQKEQAIASAFEAIQEKPSYPQAYHQLHDIYFNANEYNKAIYWAEIALKTRLPDTFIIHDPSAKMRLLLSYAYCLLVVSRAEEAWKVYQQFEKHYPEFSEKVNMRKTFEKAYYDEKYFRNLLWMVNYLKSEKEIESLLLSIPKKHLANPISIGLRSTYLKPSVWPKKSVAIFCSNTTDAWCDASILTGIGGSETAVILMSRELSKLGYKVTVYCNCTDMEGEYSGVRYEHFGMFNPRDKFDTLISWRNDIFSTINEEIKANRKIVWLHDNPTSCLPKDGVAKFDKVLVLSQYHKSLLPTWIPEEKVFITSNGIQRELFDGPWQQKVTGRIIYTSSYDRGLEQLLNIFPKIKDACPEAELHIYYGWDTYDKFTELGYNDGSFKKKMIPKLYQKGVFEHGRIGQKELIKQLYSSHIFAYPSNFAGEINCIALTQAISTGCVTITNDFAVLKERNVHSEFVVPDDKMADKIIEVIKTKKFVDVPEGYIDRNSWEYIAKGWDKWLLAN